MIFFGVRLTLNSDKIDFLDVQGPLWLRCISFKGLHLTLSIAEPDGLGQLSLVKGIDLMIHGQWLLVAVWSGTVVLANFDVSELHGGHISINWLEDQVSLDFEASVLIGQVWDSGEKSSFVFINVRLSW